MKPSRRGAAVLIITALVLLASAPGNAAGKPNPSVKHYQSPVFSTVKVTRDVQYGNANGLANSRVRLRLDLYAPAGDWAPRRPALIWAHGGACPAERMRHRQPHIYLLQRGRRRGRRCEGGGPLATRPRHSLPPGRESHRYWWRVGRRDHRHRGRYDRGPPRQQR